MPLRGKYVKLKILTDKYFKKLFDNRKIKYLLYLYANIISESAPQELLALIYH